MTNRPRLRLGRHLLPGLLAVGLFLVLAVTFVGAPFDDPNPFPADANITANIGYALVNLGLGDVPTEGFLVALIVIAIALDAALDGSIMLARRDDEES